MSVSKLVMFIVTVYSGFAFSSGVGRTISDENTWDSYYNDRESLCWLGNDITTEFNETDNVSISFQFGFWGSDSDYHNAPDHIGIPTKTHLLNITARFRNRNSKSDSEHFIDISFNGKPISPFNTALPWTSTLLKADEVTQILNALMSNNTNQITVTPIGSPGITVQIPKSDIAIKAAMYLACADNIP
ncbi:hypothetical protein [Planctobacterium marinum]|uniref:Uncharacterized protein n=1 Tax=Planctobacterium marinum TaxID=1631968 RepID=A0AA48HX18_9ALTE|nr:hypothetical protein MACH26_16810 [Planctobacterium marinum]